MLTVAGAQGVSTSDTTIVHLVNGMLYQYMKTDRLAHSATSRGTIALIFC